MSTLSPICVTCDNLSRCSAPQCPHMYDTNCLFRWAIPEGATQAETHLLYNPKATVVRGGSCIFVCQHASAHALVLPHLHVSNPQPTFTSAFLFSVYFWSAYSSSSLWLCPKAEPQFLSSPTEDRMKADSHFHQLTWLHKIPTINNLQGCEYSTQTCTQCNSCTRDAPAHSLHVAENWF